MSRSAALRFWAECPKCKTNIVLPEWSETIGERETVNYWYCSVCENEFQTIEPALTINPVPKKSQNDTELEEPFLPHLLVA